jgi:hypothetical protein
LIDDADADTGIGLGEGMGGGIEIYGVELLRGMCLEQILTEGTPLPQAFGRLFVDDAQFKLDFLWDGHKIDTLVAGAILYVNYTGVHWHWRGLLGKKGADFEDRATNIGVMVSYRVCCVWYRHEILMDMPKSYKKRYFGRCTTICNCVLKRQRVIIAQQDADFAVPNASADIRPYFML